MLRVGGQGHGLGQGCLSQGQLETSPGWNAWPSRRARPRTSLPDAVPSPEMDAWVDAWVDDWMAGRSIHRLHTGRMWPASLVTTHVRACCPPGAPSASATALMPSAVAAACMRVLSACALAMSSSASAWAMVRTWARARDRARARARARVRARARARARVRARVSLALTLPCARRHS